MLCLLHLLLMLTVILQYLWRLHILDLPEPRRRCEPRCVSQAINTSQFDSRGTSRLIEPVAMLLFGDFQEADIQAEMTQPLIVVLFIGSFCDKIKLKGRELTVRRRVSKLSILICRASVRCLEFTRLTVTVISGYMPNRTR